MRDALIVMAGALVGSTLLTLVVGLLFSLFPGARGVSPAIGYISPFLARACPEPVEGKGAEGMVEAAVRFRRLQDGARVLWQSPALGEARRHRGPPATHPNVCDEDDSFDTAAPGSTGRTHGRLDRGLRKRGAHRYAGGAGGRHVDAGPRTASDDPPDAR